MSRCPIFCGQHVNMARTASLHLPHHMPPSLPQPHAWRPGRGVGWSGLKPFQYMPILLYFYIGYWIFIYDM